MAHLLLLIPLVLAVGSAMPAAAKDSVADDAAQCIKDPRYRIGGASIGDCLMELSAQVDRKIAVEVEKAEKRYCFDEDRDAHRQSQIDWAAYRKGYCALVERSPDNTPSWVNSAACTLEIGRQRLNILRYTTEYGSPRCPLPEN